MHFYFHIFYKIYANMQITPLISPIRNCISLAQSRKHSMPVLIYLWLPLPHAILHPIKQNNATQAQSRRLRLGQAVLSLLQPSSHRASTDMSTAGSAQGAASPLVRQTCCLFTLKQIYKKINNKIQNIQLSLYSLNWSTV